MGDAHKRKINRGRTDTNGSAPVGKIARGISRVLYFSGRDGPRKAIPCLFRKSLCHLSSPAVSRRIVSNLPPDSDGPPFSAVPGSESRYGTASVYMVLQPAVRTAADVATGTGGLLPHLFTLAWPVSPKGNARLRRLFSVTDARTYVRLAVSPVRRPALPGLSSPPGSPFRAPEAAAESPCL